LLYKQELWVKPTLLFIKYQIFSPNFTSNPNNFMNKKLLLTLHLFLFSCYTIYAQAPSWQWGIRGGSADTYGAGPDETVVDMATDQHGNIYVLSTVLQTALNVDGHSVTGYGGQDILISSFKCDGTYRWAKDIGTNTDDVPLAIKVDTFGYIYMTGALAGGSLTRHISTDTTWTSSSYQSLFLLKYDTAGNYKWIRFPQPDTITTLGEAFNPYTVPLDMDIDGAGNIYLLCNLEPGGYVGGSYVVSTMSTHILKYDTSGSFIGGIPMQITTTGGYSNLRMKRSKSDKYYITGNVNYGTTLTFGSTPITQALFFGCFDNSGTSIWAIQNTEYYSGWFGRPAIDAQQNIYLNGSTASTDTFAGYIVSGGGSTAVPFIVKLDTNGINIWAKNAVVNAATVSNAITLNSGEADISGRYPGLLKWAGYADSLNLPSSSGYHIFVARFNSTTDSVLGMDSLASTTGVDNDATAMTSDNFGNFYVGGDFAVSLTVNGTTLNSIGGNSDFFVAKYGTANCECVLPTASFTHTGTSAITFTYTGSTTGIDSVVWSFGDGATSTAMNPTHTYAVADSYDVCVIAYTNCGTDTACQEVHIAPSGIANITNSAVLVYPNPATNELYIENASSGTVIRLFDIMGRQVYIGTVISNKQVINTGNLVPGTYLLQLTDADGNRVMRTIVKTPNRG
jgi:hypothetical protein